MIKLYSYFRSSAAYRVRIALNLKELPYQYETVHLLNNGGEQHSAEYRQLNPMQLVPTLVDDNVVLSQSMAIIEYLEEQYPQTRSLLPAENNARAHARELAQLISCDIHPINNLRIQKYLKQDMQLNTEQVHKWYVRWIELGFNALENALGKFAGEFCIGDQPSIADCCLVPQVYNANRYAIELGGYKNILRIFNNCQGMDAFINAEPENQPDAVQAVV